MSVIIVNALNCLREIDVEYMELKHWPHNLPSGALLAVKEAKERGISRFHIYYPALGGHFFKSDPIIVGSYKNNTIMIEVFAWDDRKVYE